MHLVRAVVPVQKPRAKESVRAVLAGEKKLSDGARSRFYISVAHQHYYLNDVLTRLDQALQCVLETNAEAQEMACWADAVALFLQNERIELAMQTLRQRRMIPKDEAMPVRAQDPSVWYAEYGRGVLQRILIPYLDAMAEGAIQSPDGSSSTSKTAEATGTTAMPRSRLDTTHPDIPE